MTYNVLSGTLSLYTTTVFVFLGGVFAWLLSLVWFP